MRIVYAFAGVRPMAELPYVEKSMNNLVLLERSQPQIATLTLNRPEKRNALSTELMRRLCGCLNELQADQSVRVVIIRGAGRVFCAGLDLAEAADLSKADESARLVNETLRSLHESTAVTIACVHGAAIAGGAGVMSACDLVVAEQNVKIGYPEVRRGLVAALVSDLLYTQVGPRNARELLLAAELIDASRAQEMGLVNRIAADGGGYQLATELAGQVLLGGPEAIRQTKLLLNNKVASAIGDSLTQLFDQHLAARGSAESQEGKPAFFETRPPAGSADKDRGRD